MNKVFCLLALLIFVYGFNVRAMEESTKTDSFKEMTTLNGLPLELKFLVTTHFLNQSLKKSLLDFCRFAMVARDCYKLCAKENVQQFVSLHSKKYGFTLDSDIEVHKKSGPTTLFLNNNKNYRYICFLIKNGISPHEIKIENCPKKTYLSLILASNNSSLLDVLHQNEYDFTQGVKESKGGRLLSACVAHGHEDFLKKLIEYDCDINIPNESCHTALGAAFKLKKDQLAYYMLEHGKVDINYQFGIFQATYLMVCLLFNEQETLLGKIPFVNKFVNTITALEFTKLLLRLGANANLATTEGCTPLMIASGKGYNFVVNELLDAGALIDALDNVGNSALWWAWSKKEETTMLLLLERGANPNIRNQRGYYHLRI
jgi:ankyrin repeat protein